MVRSQAQFAYVVFGRVMVTDGNRFGHFVCGQVPTDWCESDVLGVLGEVGLTADAGASFPMFGGQAWRVNA